MPDLPGEVEHSKALSVLEDAPDISAVFIDGCKSWAATHYAMRFLLPRTRVGSPIIFQDFGWYTCFWITSFVFAMGDLLEHGESVDSTYVFRLSKKVTAEEIARRFKVTPEAMGLEFFGLAANALVRRSVKQRDARGALIGQLHLVAALATLGRKPQAAALLKKIDPKIYGSLARMVEGSRKSPTYLPGGKQILWTDTVNAA
jgi:hypothetical protein